MKKSVLNISIVTAILFLITSACSRETELEFQDFDDDDDNLISRVEFEDEFTDNFYDDWNVTDDDFLDDEDFYTVTFDMWDADEDTLLTEEEWNFGYDYDFGDYVVHRFAEIDSDGDGYLERIEYITYLDGGGYYDGWDTNLDSFLDEEELAQAVFNRWDIDNSGFLEQDEYSEFDDYYLDI